MSPQLRLLLVAALIAVSLAGCGSTPGTTTMAFDGADLPAGVTAPDFTLTDQSGRRVSMGALRGNVVVLTFLSSNCRACTLVAQQIRGALDQLGSPADVRTVFISTDPRSDTRRSAAGFLARVSLTGRASFLLGSRLQLLPVWLAYRASAAEAAIAVLVIDRRGFQRVEFGLEQITPESLAHDIRLLRTEHTGPVS